MIMERKRHLHKHKNNESTKFKKTLVIRLNHPYRIKWDLIVMALSIWNSISAPIEIAFAPASFEVSEIIYFNKIVDYFFIIDIIFNFRTSFINPLSGDEVIKPNKIATHYVKGMFLIDLLSALPFEDIFAGFFDTTTQ